MCDWDWEHGFGITISTTDNPGWSLEIDIHDTFLQEKPFETLRLYFDKNDDYIFCYKKIEKGRHFFEGACYQDWLKELIDIFFDWVER